MNKKFVLSDFSCHKWPVILNIFACTKPIYNTIVQRKRLKINSFQHHYVKINIWEDTGVFIVELYILLSFINRKIDSERREHPYRSRSCGEDWTKGVIIDLLALWWTCIDDKCRENGEKNAIKEKIKEIKKPVFLPEKEIEFIKAAVF